MTDTILDLYPYRLYRRLMTGKLLSCWAELAASGRTKVSRQGVQSKLAKEIFSEGGTSHGQRSVRTSLYMEESTAGRIEK